MPLESTNSPTRSFGSDGWDDYQALPEVDAINYYLYLNKCIALGRPCKKHHIQASFPNSSCDSPNVPKPRLPVPFTFAFYFPSWPPVPPVPPPLFICRSRSRFPERAPVQQHFPDADSIILVLISETKPSCKYTWRWLSIGSASFKNFL